MAASNAVHVRSQRKAFAKFVRDLDPYWHPIVIHTFPSQIAEVYSGLVGDSDIEGPSFQVGKAERTHKETVEWLANSKCPAFFRDQCDGEFP